MGEAELRELLSEVLRFERKLENAKDGSIPLSEGLVGEHRKMWAALTIRIRRALARGQSN